MASPLLQRELLKRGRAYRCLLCPKHIGERRYIISHVYKYHISLDAVPFYCSLCHFQTDDGDRLEEHTRSYSKHREAREALLRSGKYPEEDKHYLHKNQDGVRATEEVHFEKLSKEDSIRIWAERLKEEGKRKTIPKQPQSRPAIPSLSAPIPATNIPQRPLTRPVPSPSLPAVPTLMTQSPLQPLTRPLSSQSAAVPMTTAQPPACEPLKTAFDFADLLELDDPVHLYSFLDGESTPKTCHTPSIEGAFIPVTPTAPALMPSMLKEVPTESVTHISLKTPPIQQPIMQLKQGEAKEDLGAEKQLGVDHRV